jgi:cholestenol Delta-isomerase
LLQVCWGPLSFFTAAFVSLDHPHPNPYQAIESLGQLYGDVLYYATCMFDHWISDLTYSRPEAAYFWGYFVFMNAFWIVIPSILLWNSVTAKSRAFKALDKVDSTLKNKQ